MVGQITTKIELAFGANLTGNPASWVWTDVSAYALGSVSVTAGRADEAFQTQPTQCTFRLNNTDARFSPRLPTSPYYPNVRRQTPVRVSLNPGTGYQQRFQGYIDVITPAWPAGNSQFAEVSVVASGSLRRLGQGSQPTVSALRHSILGDGPVEYWPLEDVSGSTQAASAVSGRPPLLPASSVNFAGDSTATPAGSVALPDLSGGGELNRSGLSTTLSSTGYAISFLMRTAAATSTPIRWGMGSGTFDRARVDILNGVGIQVNAFTSGGSSVGLVSSANDYTDGKYHFVRIILTQSGGNIAAELWVDGAQIATNTSTTVTLGAPSWIQINPQGQSGGGGNVNGVGHVAIFNGTGTNAPSSTVAGLSGETASARVTRLCAEHFVSVSVTGTSATLMGTQTPDTFLNLLRECEAADFAILYDGAGPGLTYLALPARYNQAVTLALDCNRYQVKLPFAPVEDDQRVHNDWTVTRKGGSSARFADFAHIAANGSYPATATRNVQTDSGTMDQASQLVHIFTAEEMRVPTLTFDPLHSPELQTQWLATMLGERVTATNLPSQYPYSSTDQIVEGYTETWDSVTWSVTLNLSPYRPWEVFTIQDARLGRIETDGSTLSSSATFGATSLSVASSGGLWDTGSAPFDVECEGEQITVTVVTGSSSPQTFTVTRSVNGVVKAHNSGAVVKLWRPGVLAL